MMDGPALTVALLATVVAATALSYWIARRLVRVTTRDLLPRMRRRKIRLVVGAQPVRRRRRSASRRAAIARRRPSPVVAAREPVPLPQWDAKPHLPTPLRPRTLQRVESLVAGAPGDGVRSLR
jgi:hypothetical protein